MGVIIKSDEKISNTKAFFVLLKAYIGSGILYLPAAFYHGTFITSLVGMFLIAILASLGMLLLAHAALKVPGSFEEIGRQANGKFMYYFITAAVGFSQFCFSASYVIFLSRSIGQLYHGFVRQNSEEFKSLYKNGMKQEDIASESAKIYGLAKLDNHNVLWVAIVLVPLLLFRKMKIISNISMVGIFAIMVAIVLIYTSCHEPFQQISKNTDEMKQLLTNMPNLDGVSKFIGLSLFAFEGIGLVITTLRSMRSPESFIKVCILSMIFTNLFYIVFAVICLLAFNSQLKVAEVVIMALDFTNIKTTAITILYIFAIAFSIPLSSQPAIEILKKLVLPGKSGHDSVENKWLNNALRTVYSLVMVLVAGFSYRHFGAFVEWVSFIVCIPLSFIIPPLIHYKVYGVNSRKWAILDIVFIAVGVCTMIVCLASHSYQVYLESTKVKEPTAEAVTSLP